MSFWLVSGPRSKWKKSISGRQFKKNLPAARAHELAGSRKKNEISLVLVVPGLSGKIDFRETF